jgi:hypothetical protein
MPQTVLDGNTGQRIRQDIPVVQAGARLEGKELWARDWYQNCSDQKQAYKGGESE